MASIDPGLTFHLSVELELEAMAAFFEHLSHAAREFAWPTVAAIEVGPEHKRTASSTTDLLATIARIQRQTEIPKQLALLFGTVSRLQWGQRPDGRSFHLSITAKPHEQIFSDPRNCVRVGTHVVRRLLARGVAVKGAMERQDGGACVPLVPLAKTRHPMVVTSVAEVEAAYERPDQFWSAGWNVEEFREHRLLTRCQDVISKGDVLREIIDHQWQMARASRAKLTKYGTPTVTDEERSTYEAGEPRLVPVGRDTATNVVEYSCALRHGEHLRGFEIFYLRSLVQSKRMQDGSPVSAVRVVFAEKWMAEEEKRPLLDNGIDVFYESDVVELVQVAG